MSQRNLHFIYVSGASETVGESVKLIYGVNAASQTVAGYVRLPYLARIAAAVAAVKRCVDATHLFIIEGPREWKTCSAAHAPVNLNL